MASSPPVHNRITRVVDRFNSRLVLVVCLWLTLELASVAHTADSNFCNIDEKKNMTCPPEFDVMAEYEKPNTEFRLDIKALVAERANLGLKLAGNGDFFDEIATRYNKNQTCPYTRKVSKCCPGFTGTKCDTRKKSLLKSLNLFKYK